MAKYDVEYACGHTVTTQLFGKSRDREHKIEWLKKQLCPECYKAERKKKHDKKNATALDKTKALNLLELEGSEKQVAWANVIRMDFLEGVARERKDIQEHLAYLNGDKAKNSDKPIPEEDIIRKKNLANKSLELLNEFEDYLKAQIRASWWIDKRSHSFDQLVRYWKYFVKEENEK